MMLLHFYRHADGAGNEALGFEHGTMAAGKLGVAVFGPALEVDRIPQQGQCENDVGSRGPS
jgi:hypothetical protein